MGSFKITKLNNSNYQTWKYKLEMLLLKEGLFDYVGKEKPSTTTSEWDVKDGKAKAIIGLLVEDNQLIHVRKLNTAKQYWEALKSYHEKSSLTNKVFLLKKLCKMRLSQDGDMEVHITEMLEIVDKLVNLGETLAENLTVALLLCSLPDSYDTLITALESRPEEDLTLELVKEKCIQEHKRRNESTDAAPDESALKVSHNKVNKSKLKCFHCGKIGHIKRNCFLLNNNKYRKETANIACDDRVNVQKTKTDNFCFKASGKIKSDYWYIDSAATCHMTNNKQFFDEFNEDRSKVYLADGNFIESMGNGSGLLNCEIDNSNKSISVTDVLYVPKLDGNLLSVKQLTNKGFNVSFVKNYCHIRKDGETFASASIDEHLYKLNIANANKVLKTMGEITNCIHFWHRILGHRDPEAIRAMVNKNAAIGIEISNCNHRIVCEVCIKGKMASLPFPKKSENRSTSIFELIHIVGLCRRQLRGAINTFLHLLMITVDTLLFIF